MTQVAGSFTIGVPLQSASHDEAGQGGAVDFAGSLAQAGSQAPLGALSQKLDDIIAALTKLGQGNAQTPEASSNAPKATAVRAAPVHVEPRHVEPRPIGHTGFSLTGNLSRDMQMLQQLAAGNGVDGNLLARVARAVAGEARALGNANDASVAGGIARDLGRGDYDQQGAVQAITSALLGQHVDPVKNNIEAILTQLGANGDHQSIANNLNALANQLSDVNPQLSATVRDLAGQASSGALDNRQAASELSEVLNGLGQNGAPVALPRIGGDIADLSKELDELLAEFAQMNNGAASSAGKMIGDTGFALSGDVSKDMQLLQRLVAGVGTSGSALVQVADAVADEAKSAGDSLDASVASGITRDLGRGSYDQQSTVQAITSALLGHAVDPLKTDLATVATQLKAGEQGQSIENNLRALSNRAGSEGESGLAFTASWMAELEHLGLLKGASAASALDRT